MERRRLLSAILERHAAEAARVELAQLAAQAQSGFNVARALALFTAIDRRAGQAALALTGEERATLEPFAIKTAGELARVAVLLEIEAHLSEGSFGKIFRRAFDDGDNRERMAVLRALPHLARPREVLDGAIEATRTHVLPIFEALACENKYPGEYFPELNFNQLAMKTVFMGLELSRIDGLARRRNPELARMARDFAGERRAAGRPVPSDLGLLEIPS